MDSWPAAGVPALPGQGPEPRIHDTATGRLRQAASGATATIYACGITPYDATHIGHAATFLSWDLLIRAWRDAGHRVHYVQNVTDVDDPLLERADRDGEDWRELADREIARYRSDMAALRVLPPDALVGAVEALPVIERFAGRLADRGALYELEGDQYFARSSDAAFGAMPGLDPGTMLELFAERGGDPGRPGKKDPLDPLVWLAARPGEPHWPSAFGPGRPGWHVECAAIATEHLGPRFDVQAGGSDLIFPHHEMSASHARVVYGGAGPDGPAFARRYLHAGMIRLDGEKMSKSRGNLVFVSALLAHGADPMAVRLALLAGHYRADRDWSAAGLAAAEGRLGQWRAAVARAGTAVDGRPPAGTAVDGRPPAGPAPRPPAGRVPPAARMPAEAGRRPEWMAAERVLAGVRERMASDLDAPGALAVVDQWAAQALGAASLPPGSAEEAALVRDTVDALLGIAL